MSTWSLHLDGLPPPQCPQRHPPRGGEFHEASPDKDMPLEDFLKALDTIPRKHIPEGFTVVLTGGEPLLRPDIELVGKEIRRRHMGWNAVTNGYFYDRDMHNRLKSSGLGALTISLDVLEEEHEWMRGRKGIFGKTLSAIEIAAKNSSLNFDVVTCVNKRNIARLQDIYDILVGLAVQQWRLFTIIPIGRAASDPDMQLSDSEFCRLMEFIKAKRSSETQKMNVTFSCEGYLGRYENEVRQTPFMCHAGIKIASVLIDGRICACPNIDRDHNDFLKKYSRYTLQSGAESTEAN